jgi:hypothetical protein
MKHFVDQSSDSEIAVSELTDDLLESVSGGEGPQLDPNGSPRG